MPHKCPEARKAYLLANKEKVAIQAKEWREDNKETLVVQEELEASLAMLEKYRASDPNFEQAIEGVVMAELGGSVKIN